MEEGQAIMKSNPNSRQYCVSCFVGMNHATRTEVVAAVREARLRRKAPETRPKGRSSREAYLGRLRELQDVKDKVNRAESRVLRLRDARSRIDVALAQADASLRSMRAALASLEVGLVGFAPKVPVQPLQAPIMRWSPRAALLVASVRPSY